MKAYRSGPRRATHHDDVSADSSGDDNGRHPRSIVAELRTLDSKIRMLVNKKKLQTTSDYEKVYVKGELTYIRWKLYYYLRELKTTDTVFCKKGRIMVTMKDQRTYKNEICIDSVKDLHKIWVTSINYSVLGFNFSN